MQATRLRTRDGDSNLKANYLNQENFSEESRSIEQGEAVVYH